MAALTTVLLLILLALLLMAALHPLLLSEQRSSLRQQRALQSFEAAEAGIDWALDRLNTRLPVGDDCLATSADRASADQHLFIERTLPKWRAENSTTLGNDGAAASPSRSQVPAAPSCWRSASHWRCDCARPQGPPEPPSSLEPMAVQPSALGPRSNRLSGIEDSGPAFTLRLAFAPHSSLIHITSTGCADASADACAAQSQAAQSQAAQDQAAQARDPGSASGFASGSASELRPRHDSASIRIDVSHLPALFRLPGAAITVRAASSAPGRVDPTASEGPLSPVRLAPPEPRNDPPSALASEMSTARDSRPDRPAEAARPNAIEQAASDADSLFAAFFGRTPVAWAQQPDVRRLQCTADCSAALQQAVGAQAEHPLVWLAGGLHVNEALQLGTPERPVLLVVDGAVSFQAPARIHGLIYVRGERPQWADQAGAELRGALVFEGDLQDRAATRVQHDLPLLHTLSLHAGRFVKRPGSWRDF